MYDREPFTQGTIGEVDFFEREIGGDRSIRILDIGCGTGRHSIELSRRGYRITGIDLSESMLNRARLRAKSLGLEPEFIKRDARELDYEEAFDLAIMICEGAFPLMETDEMNYAILQNSFSALKKGGKLIFTTLNCLYPLFHSVKDFINQGSTEVRSDSHSFDLMTFRDSSEYVSRDDNGNSVTLRCNERYYTPSEISWLLRSVGFQKREIFGCRLGAFSRNDPLTTEDFEMLVVAVK
jgi:2-polyprenyl-3-methyl-5-hydroxy-6-metoxy-1,4-benzoquinol methylase